MFYLVKTPWWLKRIYPRLTWDLRATTTGKTIYLTFDDGPNAVATPFVLDTLRQYGAKATFFCIGKNVQEEPEVYRRILMEGHRVGNHTHNHLNGWKVGDEAYLSNIRQAAQYIDSDLFRPPYGRISAFQAALLQRPPLSYRVIMWDVLSADFDRKLDGAQCARYVIRHTRPGAIVVFHDSEKAFDRLTVALPTALEHFAKMGYRCEAIL